jgi:hypothetical protein
VLVGLEAETLLLVPQVRIRCLVLLLRLVALVEVFSTPTSPRGRVNQVVLVLVVAVQIVGQLLLVVLGRLIRDTVVALELLHRQQILAVVAAVLVQRVVLA